MTLWNRLPRLFRRSGREPVLTAEHVVALAQEAAQQAEWPWREPVRAVFLDDLGQWEVTTNADARGANVRISIDDATSQIVNKAFLRR
jgi:hypothetical protein